MQETVLSNADLAISPAATLFAGAATAVRPAGTAGRSRRRVIGADGIQTRRLVNIKRRLPVVRKRLRFQCGSRIAHHMPREVITSCLSTAADQVTHW